MTNFKRIAACMIVVVTMASANITAYAESWSIDYTKGAPSDISNQLERKSYEGHSGSTVFVSCNSLNSGGKVELTTSGFSPEITAMFTEPESVDLRNPSPLRVTITLRARADRVVASGHIIW